MNRNRILPLAVVLMMALPSIVFLAPASAQDNVAIAPTIEWKDQVAHQQKLYLRFSNTPLSSSDNADCNNAEGRSLSVFPGRGGGTNPRRECSFPAFDLGGALGQPTGANSITFTMGELKHSFNASGNNAFTYVHAGTIPPEVSLTVHLATERSPIATTVIAGEALEDSFSASFELPEEGYRFFPGDEIFVTLTANSDMSDPTAPTVPGWTIRDFGTDGSHIEVRAADALKTAIWVMDETNTVRDLFRPLAAESDEGPQIVGAFAVRSAFGLNDARGRGGDVGEAGPVQFSITRDGQPIRIGAANLTTLGGSYSATLSHAADARAVWTFPAGQWDYRGLASGEYRIVANGQYHQGSSLVREHSVFLTAQSVVIKPYDDEDLTTTPSPLESLSHTLLPGGRTTYLMLVNNTGSVNDTFRLDATLIGGTPSTGWGAFVGGPGVLDGLVTLAPGQQKLVTLTIAAPAGTQPGNEAIHQLRAVSLLDPQSTSTSATVVSTVSENVATGVDIIHLGPSQRSIEPGVDHVFDVFVWNRGSKSANLTLDIEDMTSDSWTMDLVMGNLGVKQLQLGSVAPGDITRARLKVNGPIDKVHEEGRVTLKASNTDLGGLVKERELVFLLTPSAGVKLEILKDVAGSGHFVEVSENSLVDPQDSPADGAPGAPGVDFPCADRMGRACPEDGVDGVWFRTWITNTGRRADTFQLDLDTVSFAKASNCDDSVFAAGSHERNDPHFDIFQRDARGGMAKRSTVQLAPGETGELYIWRSVSPREALCTAENFFSFVVTATGVETGAVAREGVRVVAENRDPPLSSRLLLEPVIRTSDYPNSTRIDTRHMGKETVTEAIRVGESISYFVRVTNAASWGSHTDGRGVTHHPDIHLALQGIDRELGWNVTMRPVTGETNEEINPFGKSIVLQNEVDGKKQAWMDHEIEIRVRAPSAANATALAKDSTTFFLAAAIPGTSASGVLKLSAVVAEFNDIQLAPETEERFTRAHPGEPGAYLVYVTNNGSSTADVTFRATMEEGTPNANAWTLEPAEQRFSLPAFTNRTVALVMTPPSNAVPGQQARINVAAEFPELPDNAFSTRNATMDVTVEVTPRGTLRLDAPVREAVIAPGGFANFTMSLQNEGGAQLEYTILGTPLTNWTQTIGSPSGTLEGQESRPIPYVLEAPANVKNNTRFATVVRVSEVGNSANFDVVPLHVTIQGGKAIASVSAPVIEKTVPRGGVQHFEVNVKNLGTATDFIPLEVRSSDPDWEVGIADQQNAPIAGVTLGPNELARVNVSVKAPMGLPANALSKIELTAYAPDYSQLARVTMDALVQDYGLEFTISPERLDAFPGIPSEFILRLKNTGNANDTLNVSANMIDLPEWAVDFSTQRVDLEEGQTAEIRATVRPPKSPLPTARNYDIRFFASSLGATEVETSKNLTKVGIVGVMDYRSLDVDGDGFLEIAVDANKRSDDGKEEFREVFSDGVQSVVVAKARHNEKTTFFLDVPAGGQSYNGVADVWFDPEAVYVFKVQHAPDLNSDGSPEYFVDTDRDRDRKIDSAYDTVSDRWYTVVQVSVYGDDRIQFLVDTTGDGRPDRFYDPETKKVTRTLPIAGSDRIGIDVNDDGRVNKYYDAATGSVTDSKVRNFGDFFVEFWYFFVLFAAMALVTTMLLVRRYRA